MDAVRYMHVLGLYHTVFDDPANDDFPKPDLTGWSTAYELLDGLATNPLYKVLVTSDEERYLAWLLACIVPFSRTPPANPKINPRKVPAPATTAAREGIKTPNKVADVIKAAVRNREEIVQLRDDVLGGTERSKARDVFGMAIRRWDSQGSHWRLQVLFAVLDDVMSRAKAADRQITPAGESPRIHYCYMPKIHRDESFLADQTSAVLQDVTDNWQAFVSHLQQLDLMEAPDIKPLVDGRKLMESLGIKGGKWMAPAIEICMAWQLRNPQSTDPAGALDEVRQRKEELGIAKLLQ